jgi:hypothetical protein
LMYPKQRSGYPDLIHRMKIVLHFVRKIIFSLSGQQPSLP